MWGLLDTLTYLQKTLPNIAVRLRTLKLINKEPYQDIYEALLFFQIDLHFMKKIPVGAEACNVLVGELEFLNKPVVAFVRLSPAVLLNGMAEVPIPTRWLGQRYATHHTPVTFYYQGPCIQLPMIQANVWMTYSQSAGVQTQVWRGQGLGSYSGTL